jgi:hypothetical protein
MTNSDPYAIVDPVLLPWAKRHGIYIVRLYRDDPVRSFWVFDRSGNKRAQLWLNPPDAHGAVTVCAAAFDSSGPTKWGRARSVTLLWQHWQKHWNRRGLSSSAGRDRTRSRHPEQRSSNKFRNSELIYTFHDQCQNQPSLATPKGSMTAAQRAAIGAAKARAQAFGVKLIVTEF